MTNVPLASSNPYFAKSMIHDPEMFFGHADLLRRTYDTIAHRGCVSIVGPRGIGKSSFLWYASLPEVQRQFPCDLSRHLFVLLDLRNYLNKTSEDFFHKVSKAIIARGKKRGLILQSDAQGEDEFSSILDQIEEQGFFLVLLLDAFDKVTRNEHFDPGFFEFLRAQANERQVSYVTASMAPLYEICHSGVAGSPFFNIFYTYTMGPLLSEEARTLIIAPAQQSNIVFSEAEIALVLKWAGRHPFFIQRICYLLWEQKQNNGKIDRKQLKEQAYKELAPVFAAIWEQLPEQQREILRDEAQQKERPQRELPELSESMIFRLFVRTICRVGFFSLTTAKLEEALEKIGNLAELGETPLRLMKVVAQQIKNQDTPPTAVDKGRAIRRVLYEALQRLRGSGAPSDRAADWKHYNILNYRYFRYHLKNEQIAARLESSTRTFYRERDRAIQALQDELFEMETSADASDIDE